MFHTCLQVRSAALTEREAELALREAAVADREVRAAEAVREAEQEAKAALQHAERLEAALLAAEEEHAKARPADLPTPIMSLPACAADWYCKAHARTLSSPCTLS